MNEELRKLPGIDKLLLDKNIGLLIGQYGENLVKYTLRQAIEIERKKILNKSNYSWKRLLNEIETELKEISTISLKPVINATGVIIHTNLGRSPLGQAVLDDISPIILGYSNLEFDLNTGKRGHRDSHFKNLINYITTAEDVTIVNNNAAAVFLCLHTFAKGFEVLVSRGELVEIGGSFRIPDILAMSGAKMVEVGTTNRTRIEDYEKAITENTRVILKIHQSNYYIEGFTEEVDVKALTQLAHRHNLISIFDIGSGLLRKPSNLDLEDEPDVRSSIVAGIDIITFSGDKLLGGPQAGIICGKKKYIRKLAKAPLMRALRVGKLTIITLLSVMKNYLVEEKLKENLPIFQTFERGSDELYVTAKYFKRKLSQKSIESEIVDSYGRTGGGTLPKLKIRSFSIKILSIKEIDNERLFFRLLKLEKPIISVLREGIVHFEIYGLTNEIVDYIVEKTAEIISSLEIK